MGQLKKIVLGIFFLVGVSSTSLFAQTTTATKTPTNKPVKVETPKKANVKKTTLDTEESFKFLGNQLLFQVKKRLNLTTAEDDKKQSKSSVNKKFSFFGIEVERE